MNVQDNHLVRDIDQVGEEYKRNFEPIPKHLQAEAEEVLDGKFEANLPMDTNSRLARWAASIRARNLKQK